MSNRKSLSLDNLTEKAVNDLTIDELLRVMEVVERITTWTNKALVNHFEILKTFSLHGGLEKHYLNEETIKLLEDGGADKLLEELAYKFREIRDGLRHSPRGRYHD